MRVAGVALEAVNAWEVWSVTIPDDIEDEDVDEWIRENIHSTGEKELDDSGADSYSITGIEVY